MTKKLYGVAIVDPPWQYNNAGIKGAAAFHYPTMSDDAIAALDVAALLKPDAVVLCWATWPKLDVAIDVLRSWGVEYVTGLPWIKIKSAGVDLFDGRLRFRLDWGMGFWIKGVSEPILIARRGKPNLPADLRVGLIGQRFEHSRKPDSLYDFAELLEGPFVELFARRPRAGWDRWGNEIDNTADVQGKVKA